MTSIKLHENLSENDSVAHVCECYKKLNALGVPLYAGEENYYTEAEQILYEEAFRVPLPLHIVEEVLIYPNIEELDLLLVFPEMVQIIPELYDFDINPLSFWILDMFVEGLNTAQEASLSVIHQRAALHWMVYLINSIYENNPTREELFKEVNKILFSNTEEKHPASKNGTDELGESYSLETSKSASTTLEETSKKSNDLTENQRSFNGIWELPLPPNVFIKEDDSASFGSQSDYSESFKGEGSIQDYGSIYDRTVDNENTSERNVNSMCTILEILYRIYGRLSVYADLQTSFQRMPVCEVVQLPFKLHTPKPKLDDIITSRLKFLEHFGLDSDKNKNKYLLPLQHSEEATAYVKEFFRASSSIGQFSRRKSGKRK